MPYKPVRQVLRLLFPWLPWLVPAGVTVCDIATPAVLVPTCVYLLMYAVAATITTATLTERAAERRVPRQLAVLAAQLAKIAEEAPVAETARLTWQEAAHAFGAAADLPQAVGDDGPTREIYTRPRAVQPPMATPLPRRRAAR